MNFASAVIGETAERTDVTVRSRGWAVLNDTLLFTINSTSATEDNALRIQEFGGVVTGYTQALVFYDDGDIEGETTARLRVLEVNNTGNPPKTFVVNNSLARDFAYGVIDAPEFTTEYFDTLRNQTAQEREWVRNIDRTAENRTLGPNGTISDENEP